MPEVTVYPEGKTVSLQWGENLLEGLRRVGIDLFAPCAGKGWCGKCAVVVEAAGPDALSTVTSGEKAFLEQHGDTEYWRLACQVEVRGRAVIRIPVESRQRRWVREKTLFTREFQIEPVIRVCQVVLPYKDCAVLKNGLNRFSVWLKKCPEVGP